MLKTFAVDPALFADFQHFLLLRDKFGIPEGRQIAKFPKSWKGRVRELCEAAVAQGLLGEVRKTTIIDWMARYGNGADPRLANVQGGYEENLGWYDNAQSASARFDAVITKEAGSCGNSLQTDEDGNYVQSALFKVETQPNIKRTAPAIVDCVWPLAAVSKKLKIVEPNFSPEEPRFKKPLVELIDRLHAAGLRPEIELHVCRIDGDNDRFGQPMVQNYRNHLDPELPTGMKLTIYFWAHGNQRMHPRYLLTDIGGIKLDYGWDEGKTPEEETPAILMSETLWRAELAKYRQDESAGNAFQLDPAQHILRLG